MNRNTPLSETPYLGLRWIVQARALPDRPWETVAAYANEWRAIQHVRTTPASLMRVMERYRVNWIEAHFLREESND